ncbi:hypothetical protein [Levilactobacillus fujinensis]|uniref:Capsular polysaccharide biosynthesis protein CpsC n=1 Tax=Levilactobacillus fujinensis TaxID=2486024 RepID=A0ABW1TG50_9LACO|nr:hypothetical protein [Levilactobacillus fujinensis]
MENLYTFFKSVKRDWPLFLFPIIFCLAFASIFIGNNQSVFVSRISVQNKGTRQWDSLSIPVYQTMLKNPVVIKAAQSALKKDYNIDVSQEQLVQSIFTKPVVHGNTILVESKSRDSQLAIAMGKQVTKSMYFTLKSYLPTKKIRISENTDLKKQGASVAYSILISTLLGLIIGKILQITLHKRVEGELDD